MIDIYANSVPKLQVGSQWIQEAKYIPNHELIVAISGTNIEFWQAENMRLLHREVISHTIGAKVLISPDSKEAYVLIEGVVKIYDLSTLQLKSEHKAFEGVVADVVIYTPDKTNILIYSHWNQKDLKYRFDLVTKVTKMYDSSSTEKCIFIDDTADRVDKDKFNLQAPWTHLTYNSEIFGAHNGKVILVDDNRYIGWDLNGGKEIWRNITHITNCKDCEPRPKIVLYHHADFAIVSPSYDFWSGFDDKWDTQGLLRFDLNSGIYDVLPFKYNGSLQVSEDDKTLKIINYKGEIKEFDLTTLKNQETPQNYFDDTFDSLNESMNVEQLFDGTYRIFNKNDNTEIARFVSFKDGEWLFVTMQGYFNASSKKVLTHLNIFESVIHAREINDKEVKKYYRPDIVSTILHGKSIEALESKAVLYPLADQAKFENTYNKSLEYSFKKTNDLAFLIKNNGSEGNYEYANRIIEEIKKNQIPFNLYNLYDALSYFDINATRDFLAQRIDQNISDSEQTEIVKILTKDSIGIEKISKLYHEGKLSDWAKKSIPTCVSPVNYKMFDALLWENLEFDISHKKVLLEYLQKQDTKRLQRLMSKLFDQECRDIQTMDCAQLVSQFYNIYPSQIIAFLKNDLLVRKQLGMPYIYKKIHHDSLIEPLFNRLFVDNKLDNQIYSSLLSYNNPKINKKIIERISSNKYSNLNYYQKRRINEDLGFVYLCTPN